MRSCHTDLGQTSQQDLHDAAFEAAQTAAFRSPGIEHPVATMPHVAVMVVASDALTWSPECSGCIIQDPSIEIDVLRRHALMLALLCDGPLRAPRCAAALRGHLPAGASWSLLVDPEDGRVYVFRTRDVRVGGGA